MNVANIVTGLRFPFSAALLFCPVRSAAFWSFYLAAGLTDALDGFIARKTGTADARGARLDTAADLVFVAVCLIRLLPVMQLPRWLLIWSAVIALIKAVNVISGFVVQKRFVAAHTVMNKVTGALLFLLPLTLSFLKLKYSVPIVCAAATFAAVQEGHFIRTKRVK